MTNRKRSTVFIFLFLQFWVSSYASYGGIILTLFGPVFDHTHMRPSILAFVATGISLYLFVYVLDPEVPKKENYGLGCRVVGCLFLGMYCKIFRVSKQGKRGFFGVTGIKYDKTTISRTKEILLLYALLLPSLGIIFFTGIRGEIFFTTIRYKVKNNDFTQFLELSRVAKAVMCISMILAYFVLLPVLTLIGLKNRPSAKFLVGHLMAVVTMYYLSAVTKTLETPEYASFSGYTRIFNTRKDPVYFVPEDRAFTSYEYSVGSKEGSMVGYPVQRERLFSMKAYFNGTMTNFTMFLAVANGETIGYMVLDPPEIIRIRGPFLPLREGPPGTNYGSWPKIYVYNSAVTLQGTRIKINRAHNKKPMRNVAIQPGKMTTIALEPGKYEFSIPQVDIERVYDVEEGGVYGLMIYATSSSREMDIDTVVPPNSATCWAFIGLYILAGFASGVCYPTMRGMVFLIAPHGLLASAFAFFTFLEGISLWIGYIGFTTWHYHVTSNSLFGYSFGITLFFFACMFILLKFRERYT